MGKVEIKEEKEETDDGEDEKKDEDKEAEKKDEDKEAEKKDEDKEAEKKDEDKEAEKKPEKKYRMELRNRTITHTVALKLKSVDDVIEIKSMSKENLKQAR